MMCLYLYALSLTVHTICLAQAGIGRSASSHPLYHTLFGEIGSFQGWRGKGGSRLTGWHASPGEQEEKER